MNIASLLLMASALAASADGLQGGNPDWLVDPAVAAPTWQGVREKAQPLENRYVLFRREFECGRPGKAVLRFSADDWAAVYIDGRFVAEGPELGYPSSQPVEEIDVTSFFCDGGSHTLAASVYALGRVSRSTSGGDGRFGFMASLDMSFPDGSSRVVATDNDWRCIEDVSRKGNKPFGYDTQFTENTDLRIEPIGWASPGFDDSKWPCAVAVKPDYRFVPMQGLPLQYTTRRPAKSERRADGSWLWDMGEEMVGTPVVRLSGACDGAKVVLCQGEELKDDGSVLWKMRCNCEYRDTFTLRAGGNTLSYRDFRTFRYVSLDGWDGGEPEMTVRERHYPFDRSRTSFSCADKRFEAIWNMCVRGLVVGTQDRYMDCPSREKGQYTGDARLTAVSRWIITADPTIWRKSIMDFARSQSAEEPWLLCVAPGSFKQRLAEWSMLWPALAAEYMAATGDVSPARILAEDGTLRRFADGFRSLENADGFYCDPEKKLWILTDWPENQRCGYDYKGTVGGGAVNTWANAFYYGMLRNVAKMWRLAGKSAEADATDARADALRRTFNERLFDDAAGAYRDGLHADGSPSPKHSHQAGAGALYWGLVPDGDAKTRVVAKLAKERIAGSLFSAFYTVAALAENGEADLAWRLISGNDPHSWATMLKEGATTPFESWSKDSKWNTSLCHQFAAYPIELFARNLMGISIDPANKTVSCSPKAIASMPEFTFTFPLPGGASATLVRGADGACRMDSGWKVLRR